MIRGLFYLVFAYFGGVIGAWATTVLRPYMTALVPETQQIAVVTLGVLLGVWVAPYVASAFLTATEKINALFQSLSVHDVLMGALGFLTGLIVAALLDFIIVVLPMGFGIPLEVAFYLKGFLIVMLTIFFCYVGVMLFVFTFGRRLPIGGRPGGLKAQRILDTSVIIDGRVLDIVRAGFLDGVLAVPVFVINELQQVADSADPLKRTRGRRGLDILNALKSDVGIQVVDKDYQEGGVDQKLVKLAQDQHATLVTTDFNLHQVAKVHGVTVMNINELAASLKPAVLPGEEMLVAVVKEGKEAGQGIAYLDDGTMVVVEDGKRVLGGKVAVEVQSVLQTSVGKMIFARVKTQ